MRAAGFSMAEETHEKEKKAAKSRRKVKFTDNNSVEICRPIEYSQFEVIEKRTIKQDVIDLVRIIEDAKYELTKLTGNDAEKIYEMLNKASKKLRNLANKKELNTTTGNENV